VANYVAPVPPTPDALPAPPVLAKAVFLYDVTAGRVLYAWNARASLPMASTTKIMTALLALTYGRLDDWVTASAAAATIGGSTMDLQQGERLRLRDLLYGLLLPSGNDAAIALAEHIGGSVPAFVALMNREAAALDLAETHYVNPHGLDAPGHVTSARDLALLALAAMH
jgi:D-alanyl-D-alanine carboxypeptidase